MSDPFIVALTDPRKGGGLTKVLLDADGEVLTFETPEKAARAGIIASEAEGGPDAGSMVVLRVSALNAD